MAFYEYGTWISCSPILPLSALYVLYQSLMSKGLKCRSLWLWLKPHYPLLPFDGRGSLWNQDWSFDLPEGLHPASSLHSCLKQVSWVVRASTANSANKLLLARVPSMISPHALKLWERPISKCLDMLTCSSRKGRVFPRQVLCLGCTINDSKPTEPGIGGAPMSKHRSTWFDFCCDYVGNCQHPLLK